ncbi:hypothetical protein [Streptomyces sp. SudanB182_2057]|uniref:hypothetical protein n=1 Tax=Streptomyces sp. SudanB182_2057 TaxID=3035281 RepID=UPI003F579355
MSMRRPLGTGPDGTRRISASEADLHTELQGIHLPDAADLRARGLLPVERIVSNEHQDQEQDDPRARATEEPVPPARRPLRLRES